jgi:hypothetical protein
MCTAVTLSVEQIDRPSTLERPLSGLCGRLTDAQRGSVDSSRGPFGNQSDRALQHLFDAPTGPEGVARWVSTGQGLTIFARHARRGDGRDHTA